MPGESQKLSKEEIREDEFVEWIMKAVEYIKERSQLFGLGVVGLVLVITLINFLVESRNADNIEAANLLGDVLMAEQGGQTSEAVRLAEQLVTTYTGAPATAHGIILLANLHYLQGRYVDAEKQYRNYLDNYEHVDVLAYAAQSGLGSCLEAEGQLIEAGRHYEGYASQESGSIRQGMAQMEAARVYGLAGDLQKQRALLKSVRDNFSQYPIAAQARLAMDML